MQNVFFQDPSSPVNCHSCAPCSLSIFAYWRPGNEASSIIYNFNGTCMNHVIWLKGHQFKGGTSLLNGVIAYNLKSVKVSTWWHSQASCITLYGMAKKPSYLQVRSPYKLYHWLKHDAYDLAGISFTRGPIMYANCVQNYFSNKLACKLLLDMLSG